MTGAPILIGSEIYRRSTYGAKHPLAIPRVSTVLDLVRAQGWLDEDRYVDSPRATADQLARFHDRDYIDAVIRAERTQTVDGATAARYHLGRMGNPVFREIFSRPATACGASILAGSMLAGGGIVHNPAGGTHHGLRDRASGFCYFNDPVLGILSLLDHGVAPVVYVDIDAHHGDGVEIAMAGEERVWTLSIHEAGRWPGTGLVGGSAWPQAVNLPVPPGFNDSEMAHLRDRVVLPLIERVRPAAIVLQCGADGLLEDPLSKLALSNRSHWSMVGALMEHTERLLVLGGGGYNPWSVARCWAGVWAVLNGLDPDGPVTPAAESVLRGLSWSRAAGRNPPEHWFTRLADTPREGPVRPEIAELAGMVAA